QINLVVSDIFKAKNTFINIVSDALEVVKWFNNHSRALGMLREVQKEKFNKVLCLILPVLTRWTSHYLAVTRLLELEITFKQLMLNAANDATQALLRCAGDKPAAKTAAQKIFDILERYEFWGKLRT
ncbi:hypothetical protein BV22DRAFT_1026766, partial [Leucogyrophana mollusca]